MLRIEKYLLDFDKPLIMPIGARLLGVEAFGGSVCIWAEVDHGKGDKQYMYTLLRTGDSPPSNYIYIGSVILGIYVDHVYIDLTTNGGCKV
jgi:hypothetical protein